MWSAVCALRVGACAAVRRAALSSSSPFAAAAAAASAAPSAATAAPPPADGDAAALDTSDWHFVSSTFARGRYLQAGEMSPGSAPERPDSGDDAFFVRASLDRRDVLFGVADGVGAWHAEGVNPGVTSWRLIEAVQEVSAAARGELSPRSAVGAAWERLTRGDRRRLQGSTTLSVAHARVNGAGATLRYAQLGDSCLFVMRPNVLGRLRVAFHSEKQMLGQAPYQFGPLPTHQTPDDVLSMEFGMQPGDALLLCTDGVSDNLFAADIADIINEVGPQEAARVLVSRAARVAQDGYTPAPLEREDGYFGKPDDMTAVVVQLVSDPDDVVGARQLHAHSAEDFAKLDLRVGRFLSVSNHPTADTLYVSSVAVGDAAPRQVVSGLRPYMNTADVVGKSCVCVCNLPRKKLRGIESEAMVLAGASETYDGVSVELVTPPDESRPGARVFIQGVAQQPPLPESKTVSSIWERVRLQLRVDDQGIAVFDGSPLRTSEGPCKTSTVVDAAIT